MQHVRGVVRHYHWGDPTTIPRLLGVPADGRPWAELWFGAHPSAECEVVATGRSLAEHVQVDPIGVLGPGATADQPFPLLLKVLVAAAPLSLQVHPDAAQARAGFDREEASGIPADAPDRTYRDPHAKPELICALTPFEAWCGVRPVAQTGALLDDLGVGALEPTARVLRAAEHRPDAQPDAVRRVLADLFAQPAGHTAQVVGEVAQASTRLDGGPWTVEGAALRTLAEAYPGDVGVLVALLLNHLVLQPGQALHLRPGVLHGYVSGAAVEVQAPSDNVVRGGLTSKHIDTDELLRIADPCPIRLAPQDPDGPVHDYAVPSGGVTLSRLDLAAAGAARLDGPGLLLVTSGRVRLVGDGGTTDLSAGGTALVRADHGTVTASGDGLAHWAHAGHPARAAPG